MAGGVWIFLLESEGKMETGRSIHTVNSKLVVNFNMIGGGDGGGGEQKTKIGNF